MSASNHTFLSFDSLPADILRYRIFPLLALRCLVELDSAMCERSTRELFLVGVRGLRVKIDKMTVGMQWMASRGIRLQNYIVRNGLEMTLLTPHQSVFENLECLAVSVGISESLFADFTALVPSNSLQSLRIGPVPCNCDLDESTVQAFLSRQHNLKILTFRVLNCITDATLQTVAEHCTQLQELSIRCTSAQMKASIMSQLLGSCKCLIDLHLSSNNVTDTTLGVVRTFAKQLQVLAVSHTDHVTDTGLLAVVTECKELNSLALRGCTSLTTEGVVACGPWCTKLLHLKLSLDGMNTHLWRFFEHVRSLQNFHGFLPWDVVSIAAVYWADVSEIELEACVTDRALCEIARSCPQLRKLSLHRNETLCDTSMLALSEHCPELQYVEITTSNGITDDGVVALANACKKLSLFYLLENEHVTTRSVDAIAARVVYLDGFSFAYGRNVSACDEYNAWMKAHHQRCL